MFLNFYPALIPMTTFRLYLFYDTDQRHQDLLVSRLKSKK